MMAHAERSRLLQALLAGALLSTWAALVSLAGAVQAASQPPDRTPPPTLNAPTAPEIPASSDRVPGGPTLGAVTIVVVLRQPPAVQLRVALRGVSWSGAAAEASAGRYARWLAGQQADFLQWLAGAGLPVRAVGQTVWVRNSLTLVVEAPTPADLDTVLDRLRAHPLVLRVMLDQTGELSTGARPDTAPGSPAQTPAGALD